MKTFVLLTDFGNQDGYTAVMEGILRELCEEPINVIHLTHMIPPQNIKFGGYVLWATHKFFPTNTTFIAVVDPGVGTNRTILIAETQNYSFIAPNNGLLNYILHEHRNNIKTYILESPNKFSILNTPIQKRINLPNLSFTFHGRDIFTPLAFFYYKNKEEVIQNSREIDISPPEVFINYSPEKSEYEPEIIYIDRFGNIIFNIKFEYIPENIKEVMFLFPKWKIYVPFKPSFGYVPTGEFVSYVGSTGLLELAINQGNASKFLNIKGIEKIKLKFT